MAEKIVVTGLGVLSPNAVGREAFAQALREGRSGIDRIKGLDLSALHTRIAGAVDDDALAPLLEGKDFAAEPDRTTRFAALCASMAAADAGLEDMAGLTSRKGVLLGTSVGPVHAIEQAYETLYGVGETTYVRPSTLSQFLFNAPAAAAAAHLAVDGFAQTLSASCASGLAALIAAHAYLKAGLTDLVLVGGVDCPLVQQHFRMWDALRILTREHNDAPEKGSRPFDAERSGMVLSEGCGFVVLEREEHAAERGAPIRAEILGGSMSNDVEGMLNPQVEAQTACMNGALTQAKVPKKTVDHVQASAAGTPLGDAVECEAITRALGARAREVSVSSVKSMIGNAGAASGMLALIAAVLGIEENFIPPTVNLDQVADDCQGLNYVARQAREGEISAAIVNAFGIDGSNASVVLRRVEIESGAVF